MPLDVRLTPHAPGSVLETVLRRHQRRRNLIVGHVGRHADLAHVARQCVKHWRRYLVDGDVVVQLYDREGRRLDDLSTLVASLQPKGGGMVRLQYAVPDAAVDPPVARGFRALRKAVRLRRYVNAWRAHHTERRFGPDSPFAAHTAALHSGDAPRAEALRLREVAGQYRRLLKRAGVTDATVRQAEAVAAFALGLDEEEEEVEM
jgi:hypothetical protein